VHVEHRCVVERKAERSELSTHGHAHAFEEVELEALAQRACRWQTKDTFLDTSDASAFLIDGDNRRRIRVSARDGCAQRGDLLDIRGDVSRKKDRTTKLSRGEALGEPLGQ